MRSVLFALLGIAGGVTGALLGLSLAACHLPPPPPAYAPGDIPCSDDSQCPSGDGCRFPGVDTRAVCMWVGPTDPVGPPEYGAKRDAGAPEIGE